MKKDQTSLPTTEKFTTITGTDVTATTQSWHIKQPETITIDSNILKDPGPGCTGMDQE